MHLYDRPRRALAFAIAGLAGFVDAGGFLAADGYFVSFMSGNTTRFGVDMVANPARALVPAALIAGFVLGVAIGAMVADRAGPWRKTAVIGLAALLLGAAALSGHLGLGDAFLPFTVVAMGVLNNTFRRGGEVVIGVTYMTGALVRVGQGIAARLAGKRQEGWGANGALWASLALGAIAGAAAYTTLAAKAGWIALALAAGVAGAAWAIERRPDQPS